MNTRSDIIKKCYAIPGQMWPSELGWLFDTFKNSTSHAEIGTYCGRSLLASCGGMQLTAKVISVDNDSQTIDPAWSRTVRDATLRLLSPLEVIQLPADSVSTSRECHHRGLQFDSIFIDACHEYAECLADIQAWLPLVKNGGIVAGHDYWAADAGVMCAVNEAFPNGFQVVPNTRIWFAIANLVSRH